MTTRRAELTDLLTPAQLDQLTRLFIELFQVEFGTLSIRVEFGQINRLRLERDELPELSPEIALTRNEK